MANQSCTGIRHSTTRYVMDFSVRWSNGLDTLTGDAREIGDALSRVSKAYRAVNEATARSLPTDPGLGAVDDG
ncbi:hypothetical protein Atai01_45770 [Amycolatopsis taiwanensis]|uniref:Uncharacterized protein n=1 Tax=Amycolatopsis taiwanensis TaxID=342230 RepID=A0A9W6VE17_9PSEU|nr:hypothetical protein Atai01_45770 [Amycolatopsis taiwanensis]